MFHRRNDYTKLHPMFIDKVKLICLLSFENNFQMKKLIYSIFENSMYNKIKHIYECISKSFINKIKTEIIEPSTTQTFYFLL